MVNFKPLSNRILVKREKALTTTSGGIIIPETAAEKPQEGTVMAVGTGKYDNGTFVPTTVAVGDQILFGKWSGTEITLDKETYLVMTEDDILGIVRQ